MMFHSGDEEEGAGHAVGDGEDDYNEDLVAPKRQKLNLQFGNITGIPSALGMTGGGGDMENGTSYTKQQSDMRPAQVGTTSALAIEEGIMPMKGSAAAQQASLIGNENSSPLPDGSVAGLTAQGSPLEVRTLDNHVNKVSSQNDIDSSDVMNLKNK